MVTATEEKPNKEAEEPRDPALETLFEAGAHIGYSKSRRHPKMKDYIFCTRNDVEIFNLEKTEEQIKNAEERMLELGREKAAVIWVGTKASAKAHIKEAGARLGAPYVSERWLGGTFTNFKVLEGRMNYLAELEKEHAENNFAKYVKKERMAKTGEMNKLKSMFEGLRVLKSVPKAAVIVDPGEENTALSEAKNKRVEIFALLSNDCDPAGIHHPIAANDNSYEVIGLIIKRLSAAYEAGTKEVKKEK